MKHHKRHIHDWQWSEERQRYLCHCGESRLSEDTPTLYTMRVQMDSGNTEAHFSVNGSDEQPLVIIGLHKTRCWSCLGSGYSDYAVGQPCTICGGWGYWETIQKS